MSRSFMTVFATFLFITSTAVLKTAVARAEGAIEMPSDSEAPAKHKVGRKAAQKYMGQTPEGAKKHSEESRESSGASEPHYLAIHLGSFVSDNSYKWGAKDSSTNVGRFNMGLTYRVGEWVNSMDFAMRVDYLTYALDDGHASQLVFSPTLMFPDATSHFPLYFGAGVGPGIFLAQLHDEANVSLNYSLFAGVRMFDVVQNTGFFIEAGLKNLILLTSDGQFNGTFVAAGAVFSF